MTSIAATRLLALCLALCLTPAATSQIDAEIRLGDQFQGVLDSADDQDVLAFEGIAGQLLSVTAKGKDGTLPVASLFDDEQQFVDTLAFEKGFGTKSFKIVNFPLPHTGDYLLAIDPAVAGAIGPYSVKTKGKAGKDLKSIKAESMTAAGAAADVAFDAPAGAVMSAKVGPGKKSAAIPAVVGLAFNPGQPDQSLQDVSTFSKIKGAKTTVKKVPLTETGSYALLVDNAGDDGSIKRSVKVKFPKFKKTKFVEGLVTMDPGSIAGTIVVQDLPAAAEQEPNDAVEDTQFIGGMGPGSVLRVVGAIGPADPGDVDGFRVQIDQDQTVSFMLHHDSQASDLDIYVYEAVDPFGLIASFATGDVPEAGSIAFGGVPTGFQFDVVLVGFGDTVGDYLLTVSSSSSTGGLVAPLAYEPGAPREDPLAAAPRPNVVRATDRRMGLDRPFVPGEVVVKLADAGRDAHDWAAERGLGLRIGSPSGYFVATLPELAGRDDRDARLETARAAASLRADPGVASAQVNALWQALQTPNDEFLPYQWHYPVMRVNEAWAITTGSADVLAAIIDTGITPHPDLVDRDSGTGYDMISLTQISLDGDGIDADPTDVGDLNVNGKSSFHGTHVAGTIGASTDNGVGVAGVDWACELMHVRALGNGGGTSFDIAEAIRYAARLANDSGQLPPKAADVINMSLGGGGFDNNVNDACQAAIAAGCVIVAAAGNENTSQQSFPAAYDNVISVGAVDVAEQRAPYSNYGSWVDVCAPGGNMGADLNQDGYADGVLSTKYDGAALAQSTPVYAFENGTSMASPHVAGLVALMRAVDGAVTPAQVESYLETTGKTISTDQPIGPLCDAVEALKAVQEGVGGGGDTPLLAVSTTQMNFGSTTTQINASITNVGGGSLTVNPPQVSETTGSGWLSAVVGTPTATNYPLIVSVDRSGQAAGSYSGTVSLTSNGGNATINVSMSVTGGTQGLLDVGDVYVLAVDLGSLETMGQDVTTAAVGAYQMDDVDPGEWLIVAGPDLDNDGFICGPGEPCGFFPVPNDPVLVTLPSGGQVTGVDFFVVDSLSLPSAVGEPGWTPPAAGFPRADAPQPEDDADAD